MFHHALVVAVCLSLPALGAAKVELKLPAEPLLVGTWHDVPIALGGAKLEDLAFEVVGRPDAALVSPSVDSRYDPQNPTVVFMVGWRVGQFELRIRHRPTGQQVGAAKFAVADRRRREKTGPSLWMFGDTGTPPRGVAGAAWGGGPAGVQPQNSGFRPAPAVWRVALVLVDTADQRYTLAESGNTRTRWLDEAVNGVAVGGVTRSVRAFYREVSHNQTDLTVDAFGPVSLGGDWEDYFRNGGETHGAAFEGLWFWQDELWRALGAAGIELVDFEQYDSVVAVMRSVPAAGGEDPRFAWPLAFRANFPVDTDLANTVQRGVIAMPHDWGTADTRPDRRIHETLAHELGHNLGLPDLYRPTVAGRNLEAWDMMHRDSAYPHFSLPHRMILGWVPDGWLKTYNFAQLLPGQLVNETVTLRPAQLANPPAGQFGGIEIRIADGWNYYLEYRRSQSTQTADQALPANARLLITDVISPSVYTLPSDRPVILTARTDLGDGPVLGAGQDYVETDLTEVQNPLELTLVAENIATNTATVRVKYQNTRPDPSIRPWPASDTRQWQSPDIEVRNARSEADSSWFNTPWVAHNNTIVATVSNNTDVAATGVEVDFYAQPFNLGMSGKEHLGSDTKDIPARGSAEFTCSWVPSIGWHTCLQVQIQDYKLPGSLVPEATPTNNRAQSNYDRFISRWGSPPSREATYVTIGNPFDRPTRYHIVAFQTNPLYRTYLETTEALLGPGETRQVLVMIEYAVDDYTDLLTRLGRGEAARKQVPAWRNHPNFVRLQGYVTDPLDPHVIHPYGGAEIMVEQGRATRFIDLIAGNDVASGTVVTVSDNRPVRGGTVIATSRVLRGRVLATVTTQAEVDGSFKVPLPAGWRETQLYFVPPTGFGDTESPRFTSTGRLTTPNRPTGPLR